MAKRKLTAGGEIQVDPHRSGEPVFEADQESPQRTGRGTAAERGFGKQWQDYAAMFLGKVADRRVTCIACVETLGDAWCVDHIIPVNQNLSTPLSGAADKVFWPSWNHQPLCRRHHTMKTLNHDRWYTANRDVLLKQIRQQLERETEEHEIRNWLIRQHSMWPLGWFNLDPDPAQNYALLQH